MAVITAYIPAKKITEKNFNNRSYLKRDLEFWKGSVGRIGVIPADQQGDEFYPEVEVYFDSGTGDVITHREGGGYYIVGKTSELGSDLEGCIAAEQLIETFVLD